MIAIANETEIEDMRSSCSPIAFQARSERPPSFPSGFVLKSIIPYKGPAR